MAVKIFHTPEVKLRGEGNGFLEGYASTFGNWDDTRERPIKGAFLASLPAFLKDGFIGVQHQWGLLPIATPLEAREDDHGLFVAAEFHSTDEAQKARCVIRERLEREKSVKLSIGYEVLEDEFVEEGRLLKKLDLLEWSYVLYPANKLADVTNAKGRLPDGLSLSDHSETVLAAAKELFERYEGVSALRAKAGRVLSAANVARLITLKESLTTLVAELDALVALAEPEKAYRHDALRLRSASTALRRRARELGVQV